MRLATKYLGLDLDNPLVPSASPLSREVDTVKELEDAGAPAIVLYSLFEEEIHLKKLSLIIMWILGLTAFQKRQALFQHQLIW